VLTRRRTPRYPTSPARAGLVAVLMLGLAGCYHFVPLNQETPIPGEHIRVRLSPGAAMGLTERLGQQVRTVEGPLISSLGDSLSLDVGWGGLYAGTPFEGRRETLSFSADAIVEVERRELSRTRTGVVGGLVLAATVLVIQAISGGGGRPGRDGTGAPPQF